MSETQLWFDLEGTVIPTWDHLEFFTNMPSVEELKAKYKPDRIGVYSYAIHTSEDVTRLKDSSLYEWLVRGSKTCPVPTTLDRGKHWANFRYFGNPVILGTSDVWKLPKEYSFIMTMVGMYGVDEGIKFILFDDTVGRIPHMKIGNSEFIFIEARDSN